jgi:GNAT superfamily N-acetyltransferase
MTSEIRLLTRKDIQAWIPLKDAAGWNQTAEDLELLLELSPEGCFGIDADGTLVSTATAITYEQDLAWIGMVLTLPQYRGRGFASRLFEHSLKFLEERQVTWVRLDATELGLPIYRKYGFEVECPIERWSRPPGPASAPYLIAGARDFSLDGRAFGANRHQLLMSLSRYESCWTSSGQYAMGRAGSRAAYFGPCVAKSPGQAESLLGWFLSLHSSETVYWDLFPEHAAARRIAEAAGFRPIRKLWRMALRGAGDAPAPPAASEYVYAIAGFELG